MPPPAPRDNGRMRAVLVDAPESLLEERRRLGIDKIDECWDGEWHIVNPPKHWHGRLNTDLLLALAPLARAVGLEPYGDATGLFEAENNWRVPDQAYARPEDASEDGLTSAQLVVEIRSPGDESYQKLPFYASRGVTEVLIVHQDRRFELHRLRGDEQYAVVEPDPDASTASTVLPVALQTVAGPALRVIWASGLTEV